MLKSVRFVSSFILITTLLLAACAGGGGAGTTPTAEMPATGPTAAPTTAAEPTEAATATTEATATTAAEPTVEETATTEGTEAADGTQTPQAGNPGQQPGGEAYAVTSVQAETAPELDGAGDDEAWANAPETVIETAGGVNESDTQVTVKSVYDDENVYFLLTWADPTQSWERGPWEKQADGSWIKLADPENKGGDDNLYYEDKISLIWNIDDSIQNFNTQGCFVACHAGENSDVKPYGNKYTNEEGEIGDIWHWKSVRNVGQVDDQFLDHTRYSADAPGAGRKSDENTGGGYKDNDNEDKTMPAFMLPEGDKTGAPGFILDEEKVPFDDTQFEAGDRVPGVVAAPYQGDRGDLSAGWQYADGTWTLEISRALTTESETDVQFDDLGKEYHFGLATFDNAQVRHAFQNSVTVFRFERPR